MILRILIEGAIKTKFAKLFGGKFKSPKLPVKPISLYEENLKFGYIFLNKICFVSESQQSNKCRSMPTQPLGASTVFHAGIIGDGKRCDQSENPLSKEDIETNTFILTSIIFKLCHCSEKQKDLPARTVDYMKREMSKEACRQLALLLVDLVSPGKVFLKHPFFKIALYVGFLYTYIAHM